MSQAAAAQTPAAPAAPAPAKKKSGNWMIKLGLFLGSLGLIITTQTAFIFLLAGLLPAIVAALIDNVPGKPQFKTVLACNLAGLLPYFAEVAGEGNSAGAVQQYMTDPMVWLVVYSSAGIGWGLVWFFPMVARAALAVTRQGHIAHVEHIQKRLVEEWGQEIKKK